LPISREGKEAQIAKLAEYFQKSEVIIWAEYRGLPTPRLNELRRALRPHQAEFHVVKNTLAALALQRAGLPVPDDLLKGPTVAGVVTGDIAAASRTLVDFGVANRELVIKGGQANQRLLRADEVRDLVNMPSRSVMLGRVLGQMSAPVSGLVTVLGGTLRGLLYVLQAHAKGREEAGA